jgi:predicted alpha-1,2-mannosidase
MKKYFWALALPLQLAGGISYAQQIHQLPIPGMNISLHPPALSDSAGDHFQYTNTVDIKKVSANVYYVRVNILPSGPCSPGCVDLPLTIGLTKTGIREVKKAFHWLPNLKNAPGEIIAQHVFRSPSLLLCLKNNAVVFIPDINQIKKGSAAPFYFDLHYDESAIRINYGLSNYDVVRHQYYKKSNKTFPLNGPLELAFYILISPDPAPLTALRTANGFMWKTFASKYTHSYLPQTLTYKEYAKVGYGMALKNYWVNGPAPGQGGITLSTFYDDSTKKYGGRFYKDDLWYHSWFNNIRTAYGLFYWGKALGKKEWQEKAIACLRLILSAPADKGWFPTIYAGDKRGWIASGQGGGAGLYHMPDNVWTALWVMRFNDELQTVKGADRFVNDFSAALLSVQNEDGSFPARVNVKTHRADSVLRSSASSGMATWFLEESMLRHKVPPSLTGKYSNAIRRSLDFLDKQVLPNQRFEDFELYFSCSPKPMHYFDTATNLYGQNTLSIQWCAEAYLKAYQLFKDPKYLRLGEYCLNILSLYQQVWNPPFINLYAFGGFGVQNTDAEWNDARQAQFAETYLNYYFVTKNKEYLERSVYACRSSFALMVIPENKEICPANYQGTEINGESFAGSMAENFGHSGYNTRSYQSGFHWGTGSALTTAAILKSRLGDLYVGKDFSIGVDGVVVDKVSHEGNVIDIRTRRLPGAGMTIHKDRSVRQEIKVQAAGISVTTSRSLVDYVDPFIGTSHGGNVFHGATLPFGMVKLGPDCNGNATNSGYGDGANTIINGFSHVHVSGSGGGPKYGNILLQPFTGDPAINDYGSPLSQEQAMVGNYKVRLDKYKIDVSLTTTRSVGLHAYTFPASGKAGILIDAGHFLVSKHPTEHQELVGSEVKIVSPTEIEGYSRVRGGWGNNGTYTVYFDARFDTPADAGGVWEKDSVEKDSKVSEGNERTGAWFSYRTTEGQTIKVKVGISYISTEKARQNIRREIPGWDFDRAIRDARTLWEEKLDRIEVETPSDSLRTMFYTALYHSLLMPVNKTGENSRWQSDQPYYDDYYAIWDTYRCLHPLLTLIAPSIQRDMLNSLIDIYRHDKYMPDARSGDGNGVTQGGSNADILIADAFVKGLKGIDYETALKAMIKNAEVPPGDNERKEGRGGLPDYNSLGYVSVDYERSGTRTAEYSADDYAIAVVAKGLHKDDSLYKKYLRRSSNWKNLWRPLEDHGATGFIWPRKKDGSWLKNFTTLQDGSWRDPFYESHSWEMSFYVPQDIDGLIAMAGGKEAFRRRLDTFFINGYYNVNNEPGFLTPVLYNWIGRPDLTAQRVCHIINTNYNTTRKGLPGNDDAGAMSSWLVFHLLGFFPVAGQDLYAISSPHFKRAVIHLENGNDLVIRADNVSDKNIYIRSASLNGHPLDKSWFRHTRIAGGGELVFEMGSSPGQWGKGKEVVYQTRRGPADYVNPLVGTAKGGYTFPGAVVPWGMVSVSPHNNRRSFSGYNFAEPYLYGFGHVHLSGVGCQDLGNIVLMPTRGAIEMDPEKYRSPYGGESAKPGYYGVDIRRYGIMAEMSATIHTGISVYTFPASNGEANILVDASSRITHLNDYAGMVKVLSPTKLEGSSMSGDFCSVTPTDKRRTVYFAIEFSKPAISYGVTNEYKPVAATETSGGKAGAYYRFDTREKESIVVKTGVSYVSTANAWLNLETEQPGWNFEAIREAAYKNWNTELSRIEVKGGTTDDRTTFYTGMYHMLLHPNVLNDVNGEYPSMGHKEIARVKDHTRYTVYSLWDTYRNEHPFLSLVYPSRQLDMVRSMIDMYKESGWFPKWELGSNETYVMVGDPSIPVIADTWLKGIRGFDMENAFEGMLRSATQVKDNPMRPGLAPYLQYGYIPMEFDKGFEMWGPVSTSLEYNYADWCLAQLAKSLDRPEIYTRMLQRSMNYKKLYDPGTGFLRPRNKDGAWYTPFDPSGGDDGPGRPGYVEGDAWQYSFFVPHDIPGLMDLMGSKENFLKKLQECFDKDHYTLSNEPDMAYPFLFNYVPGEEWRTQQLVRTKITDHYFPRPDGVPGNDDAGVTSALYVFSAMGLYPDCPASNTYQLTSPLFDEIVIHLDSNFYKGKEFVIRSHNNSRENKYIRSMRLNGKEYTRFSISHATIVNGGELDMELSASPGAGKGITAEVNDTGITARVNDKGITARVNDKGIPARVNDKGITARVDKWIGQMTQDEKLRMLGGYKDFDIMPIPRLGIPEIHLSDGPLGVRGHGPSTAYPAGIALAATFNTELAKAYGKCIGKEAKAKDIQIMLGPAMNIYRAPMCGRNFEYYGEDPFLAGRIASNYVIGMQGEGVMATAKHFAANNQEYDRNGVSSDVDERTLNEIYLPAFKACVQEGKVGAVMSSYNPVNGIYATQNDYLLNQVLKKDWGFQGFVMSDWGATHDGIGAARAGLDIEMPSAEYMRPDTLKAAIAAGRLNMDLIDDKVRRLLTTCMKFGLFDTIARRSPPITDFSEMDSIALQTAAEGIVLLKNAHHLLPLDKEKIKTIAVLGPNADPAVTGGSGSSMIRPYHSVSVLEGIRKIAGRPATILYNRMPGYKVTDEFYEGSNFLTQDGRPGLTGEYFRNESLRGRPAFTRVDRTLNFSYPAAIKKDFGSDNFSARWTGKLKVLRSGTYRMVVSGDDGYRLYLDGKLVIDRWQEQGEFPFAITPELIAGREYAVRLEYFQAGGLGAIRFGYAFDDGKAMKEALDMAHKADVAIVCVGFDHFTEGESYDRSYGLPPSQEAFIKQVTKANKNCIVIVNAGGNAAIANWKDGPAAILHAWYPGQEGGAAIAQILFGLQNPSGKLPISIEKKWEDLAAANSYYDRDNDKHVAYTEGILTGYRHFDTRHIEPLYPFGFGLSYTEFEYSNLRLSNSNITANDSLTITADIKNTGKRTGKETIQLYISQLHCSVQRPVKELKAFAKVELQPGETRSVSFCIHKDALSFYDIKRQDWLTEPGDFMALVGSSSKDIRLKGAFKLK